MDKTNDDLPPQPIREHSYEIKPVPSPTCQFRQDGDWIHCTEFGHNHGSHVPGYVLEQRDGKQVLVKL